MTYYFLELCYIEFRVWFGIGLFRLAAMVAVLKSETFCKMAADIAKTGERINVM